MKRALTGGAAVGLGGAGIWYGITLDRQGVDGAPLYIGLGILFVVIAIVVVLIND